MANGDKHWTVAQRSLVVGLVKHGKLHREVKKPISQLFRIMGRFKKFGTTASLEG